MLRIVKTALLLGMALMMTSVWGADRKALGRTDKLRVLVDKVLMADNKWVMTDDHVREIAEAGFNVVSPRLGNEDMNEVRKIAGLAAKYGIFHLPWMRGTMIPKGDVKMVWADGSESNLASPNSDELWAWMTEWILNYARVSVECPALFGVFLDYENYSSVGPGTVYELSYDDKIMGEFAAAQKCEVPKLPFAERAKWLRDNKLDQAFRKFQINSWRERCRTLRQQVDAINPTFQFMVYPAPGSLFMTEAALTEWSTKAAPTIWADASIYGRPAGLMPHKEALEANRELMVRNMKYARTKHVPFMYAGGLDPVVKGADPEFTGRNAAMSGCVTDGYWVFYEGPEYKTTHRDYFRWFRRANRAIVNGTACKWWQQPRQTPDPGDAAAFVKKTDKPQLGVFDTRPFMMQMLEKDGKFEVHELMGLQLDYLKCFDVIILQNYNVTQKFDAPFARTLRQYVEEGGRVMLAHDTAWFMDSPFPEVATRALPQHNVEAERHVVDTNLRIKQEHAATAGLKVGTEFPTEFRDHMIFKPGAKGVTVVENTFGDPVYVLGQVGKGRVAFVGPFHGYKQELSGTERQVFLQTVEWLAGK